MALAAMLAHTQAQETWTAIGEGTYSDVVLSNLFSGYFNDPVTVTVEESDQTPGRYRIVNPWPGVTERPDLNYLIIDATDPDFVMIPQAQSPVDDPVNGETYYRSINEWAITDMGLTKEQFLGSALSNCNATLVDGVIQFPNNILGVMWPYAIDYANPGEWTISNGEYPGYLVLPGNELSDEWEELGTGRMLDGFVWTVFEGSAPVEKDIEIMRSTEREGVYKLVKPFNDIDENSRDLIIDASDPDFVIIEQQNTGIDTEDFGYTYILSASANGYADYETMVAVNPEYADFNITITDGRIDIPAKSVFLFFPDTDPINIRRNDLAVDSYILLPGHTSVRDINACDDEAATEYYNLQGVRIAEPASGQIVIVRRGDKAFKAVMP